MIHSPCRAVLGLTLVAAFALAGAPPASAGGVADPAAVAQALEVLETDDRKACAAALEVLASADDKDTLEKVAVFGAETAHRSLTERAGELVAKLPGKVAHKTLARLAKHHRKRPDRLVRIASMARWVEGDHGLELLMHLTAHPNDSVAAAAVRGIATRDPKEVRSRLDVLARSPRVPVAAAAAMSLVRVAPDLDAQDLLLNRVLKGKDDRIGDFCAIALSEIEDTDSAGRAAIAALPKLGRSPAFHAVTKLALRSSGIPDQKTVIALLAAKNDRLREVGCDLAGMKARDDADVQTALYKLARRERDWRVRVSAWLALSRAGIEAVRPEIVKTIPKDGEHSYWAIQCANRHPHPDTVGVLRNAALDTKDPVRRELAQRALRRHPDIEGTRSFFLGTVFKSRGSKKAAAALLGLGNLKDEPAFLELVTELARSTNKDEKFATLKGLEKLTGHFYEPVPETWMDWHRVMGGQVAYEPVVSDRKGSRARLKGAKKIGITPETEAAVEAGLVWLAEHQDATGGWNGSTFDKHCPDRDCRDEGGHRDRELAYTALALLCYQGAGYTHLEGPYKDVVRRGFEFLMANQDYDGSHLEKSWTFSYEAAVVCQALCDGYQLTDDPWVGQAAQRIIDYLVKVQHPGATWRYSVRTGETDTSVMSWIMMACVSARAAGLDVPEQIFVSSEAWLDRSMDKLPEDTYEVFVPSHFDPDNTYHIDVTLDQYGKPRTYRMKTWYQPPQLYTPAMPAIGALCRIWTGWTRAHPAVIGNVNTLLDHVPGYGNGLAKEYAFYPYTWYYGSLAMYQMGGRHWNVWRKTCITGILENQHKTGHLAGSWSMPREQFAGGLTGGPVYCTAMCILTLETFYRYQPYLARAPMRSNDEDGNKELDSDDAEKKDDDKAEKDDGDKSE